MQEKSWQILLEFSKTTWQPPLIKDGRRVRLAKNRDCAAQNMPAFENDDDLDT